MVLQSLKRHTINCAALSVNKLSLYTVKFYMRIGVVNTKYSIKFF